tara:strand:- start:186 stop:773 length:588 start_codon:yes stop_codon:yes gene_type:complete
MKNILQIILISLFCLTFISCAKKDDSSTTTTELEGTWSAACYVATDNLSYKNTITVSGTDVITKYEVHSDSSCNTDLLTWEDTYSSLSIGDEVTFSSGATGHQYTFNVVSFKLTLQTTDGVSALNAESSCGVSDWALDTATNYTGKTCGSTVYDAANTTYLGLYKLVGNNLFLGGFSSTGSYPTSVLNTITYVKQ